MQDFLTLTGIIGALFVGVMSPGPSFILITRVAVSTSRSNAIAASIGMGIGGVLFAIIALLGIQSILIAVPALYIALKVFGGLYLCYLAYSIFKNSKTEIIEQPHKNTLTSMKSSFCLGLITQTSNPKTAIVYASVFAAFLPTSYSLLFSIGLLLIVFTVEASWYMCVALLMSSAQSKQVYLNYKTRLDRLAGVVMSGLGIKLLSTAASESCPS